MIKCISCDILQDITKMYKIWLTEHRGECILQGICNGCDEQLPRAAMCGLGE